MTTVAEYKDKLDALKAEYQARIDKISDHTRHPQDELQHHWDDQAVAATRDEMRKALLIEAEQGLRLVNAALYRIENGGFGVCAECGEDIEAGRLDAVPYATLCMTHANAK